MRVIRRIMTPTRAAAVVALLWALPILSGNAEAQGTPVPVPGEGGIRPPVYIQEPQQPQPATGSSRPATSAPTESGTLNPPAGGVSEPAPVPAPTASPETDSTAKGKVPQTTSFPELTQGAGSSGALLGE